MLKRYIRLIFITLIVIAIGITMTFKAYAVTENDTITFASVKLNNVTPGGDAEITLDLTDIKYESYNIKVLSSAEIQTPSVTNAETGEEINEQATANQNEVNNTEVNQTTNNDNSNQTTQGNNVNVNEIEPDNNNGTEFTINNLKNLNKLALFINIPNTSKIGDQITITIVITDTSNSQNTVNNKIILNVVSSNQDNNQNNNQSNENQNNQENNKTDKNTDVNQIEQKIDSSSKKTSESYETEIKTSSQKSMSDAQTITYNGSADNYLTNIYINGNTVSNNYNKTDTTYFSTVDAETTNVDISYDKSDTNSTVCVYGNSSLKSGTNKILISVTAENGNVRYYRIYLTVKS